MSILYKGMVHPWLCDIMGHLATRHYMAMFDEASYQLLAEATGWQPDIKEWKDIGWFDVHHEIDYKAELSAGALVQITGGIKKLGNSSVRFQYEMKNKITGDIAATLSATSVLFDLDTRKSMTLNCAIRSKLDEYQNSGQIDSSAQSTAGS